MGTRSALNGSCSQLVILPSGVRRIPFAVPGLDLADDNESGAGGGSKWRSEPNLLDRDSAERSSNRSFQVLRNMREADSLGSLDPSLYINSPDGGTRCDNSESPPYEDDNIGRVWFTLEYNPDTERLVIQLSHIKNLQSRVPGSSNSCYPFVRISLMPDERRWMQTKAKRKTCNPIFDEEFVFQISHKDFENRALKFTVFDVDRYRRHVTLGHVVYPLQGHVFDERLDIWRDLERELIQPAVCQTSELQISLLYNDSIERLTVGIFGGKNFSSSTVQNPALMVGHRTQTVASYYVKLSLSRPKHDTKKKRTATVKYQLLPVAQQSSTSDAVCVSFNESFSFKLPANCSDSACLAVTVMQCRSATRRDKQVGRVVLGSRMFARGPEREQWTAMFSAPKQQISQWHKLC